MPDGKRATRDISSYRPLCRCSAEKRAGACVSRSRYRNKCSVENIHSCRYIKIHMWRTSSSKSRWKNTQIGTSHHVRALHGRTAWHQCVGVVFSKWKQPHRPHFEARMLHIRPASTPRIESYRHNAYRWILYFNYRCLTKYNIARIIVFGPTSVILICKTSPNRSHNFFKDENFKWHDTIP
jgi:hypothetical protein